jgi:hypothetical protein
MGGDCWDLTIEVTVEQINQDVRRQAVGECSKSPHIGQPDGGMNRFGVATADLAGKNARTRLVSHISVEKIGGHTAHGPHLGNSGERGDHRFEGSNLRVGKASGGPGRPSDDVDLAIRETQWAREVIRDPISTQLAQDRKVIVSGRLEEPPSDRTPGRINARNGAFLEFSPLRNGVGRFAHLHLLALPPQEATTHQMRMQRAHEHGDAPKRDPACEQLIA